MCQFSKTISADEEDGRNAKNPRYSEEWIAFVLRQGGRWCAGERSVPKMGITEQACSTSFRWAPVSVEEEVFRSVPELTTRVPTGYLSIRADFRAVSTLNPGIILASFEHWSTVTSLHSVVNSPMMALRLPVRVAERRREIA